MKWMKRINSSFRLNHELKFGIIFRGCKKLRLLCSKWNNSDGLVHQAISSIFTLNSPLQDLFLDRLQQEARLTIRQESGLRCQRQD
jgi:hypothetical protein